MMRTFAILFALVALGAAGSVKAQDEAQERVFSPAAGLDVFASTDADDTDILKTGISFDWRYSDPDHYQGIRIETARFAPLGQDATVDERIYYRFADKGEHWAWNGMVGTDGDTLLGSFSVHNESRIRQEYFVERERLETPLGLERELYHTFVGGAFDLPVSDRTTFTAMIGVQDFSGDNTRLHLRANYIQVLKADWGLSAQLRTRYFHNSDPREFDYFSPEWYAEVMPVVQVRRFYGGWRYQAAVGLGAQRDADSDWRSARYFEASIATPPIRRDWVGKAAIVHSNTPVTNGYTYDYNQVTLSLTRVF